MNTEERTRLENLTPEEQEIRQLVIKECADALTPYAFTSIAFSVIRKLLQ